MTTEDVREQAEGLAASEEELVLIAMFGRTRRSCSRSSAGGTLRDSVLIAEDADAERGERIRELVKIVQESGVGEIEIEDEGMARVGASRRRAACAGSGSRRHERRVVRAGARARTAGRRHARRVADGRGLLPRPEPGAPAFVDVGDTVVPGQVLCILEAMKFNELKAETAGVVRRSTPRTRSRSSTARSCSSSSPSRRRPSSETCSNACSSRIEARSPCG